jgi:type I restriction enzyme S subunit
VDNQLKQITGHQVMAAAEAPSRARQLVAAGDILVSTVRPNLNGVAQVPGDLDGSTASTGFCVLRPRGELHSEYLFQWVKSPAFVGEMVRRATGQSYPAVSDRIIFDSEVPLPSLDEQRRIAAILDQADALRRKRRAGLQALTRLKWSLFRELFGDPTSNPMQWPFMSISSLTASSQYGSSAKAGALGNFPMLRMGNITYNGDWALDSLKYVDLSPDEVEKFTVRAGDMLFNRTNSPELVGKAAVFRESEPYAFAGYLVRIRTNALAHSEYVSAYLNSSHGKATLRGMCKSIVGMANINAKELGTIRLPVPPVQLQQEFADRIATIRVAEDQHRSHLLRLDALFASLQHRAFRGEL